MPTKPAPTKPHMSPAHLLRRLAMSTTSDPRVAALRARLLPAPGAQAAPQKGTGDTVEKALRDETPRGPKRRKTVTVNGKHGRYQSTRMVGTDKPAAAQGTGRTPAAPAAPAAPEAPAGPAAKPTLAFSKARAATGTLNGVPFAPWDDVPTDNEGWAQVDGQDAYLEEPAVPELTEGFDGQPKGLGSGVIIQEPDGRVWLCKPTNSYGGYNYTFPKGGTEDGLSLQANAIKECFEESGLQVKITGFAGDIERSTSVARYYFAQRVGGSPTEHGWESEGVVLVDPANLHKFLNQSVDQKLAHAHAGAPEPPPKPKPPTLEDYHAAMKAKYGDAYDPKYKPKPKPGNPYKSAPNPNQGGLFGPPAMKKLPSLSDLKSTVKLLPPGIPNAYAMSTKNGPAFQELLDLQLAVKAGELSPAEGAMLAEKVPATDPASNSVTALDFQRKRLVAYLTQQAGPAPTPSPTPAASAVSPLVAAINANKAQYAESIVLPATYDAFTGPQAYVSAPKKDKLCYSNALALAQQHPDMKLAIGYLTDKKPNSAGYIGTSAHAWLINSQGQVYDPTLGKSKTDHYVGRQVSDEEMKQLADGDAVRELLFSETHAGYQA